MASRQGAKPYVAAVRGASRSKPTRSCGAGVAIQTPDGTAVTELFKSGGRGKIGKAAWLGVLEALRWATKREAPLTLLIDSPVIAAMLTGEREAPARLTFCHEARELAAELAAELPAFEVRVRAKGEERKAARLASRPARYASTVRRAA